MPLRYNINNLFPITNFFYTNLCRLIEKYTLGTVYPVPTKQNHFKYKTYIFIIWSSLVGTVYTVSSLHSLDLCKNPVLPRPLKKLGSETNPSIFYKSVKRALHFRVWIWMTSDPHLRKDIFQKSLRAFFLPNLETSYDVWAALVKQSLLGFKWFRIWISHWKYWGTGKHLYAM